MACVLAGDVEDPLPTIEDILSHADYNGNSQQQAIDREKMCKNEATGPRPLTCFLYNGLTTNQLRTFLLDRRASAACILHHLTRLEEVTSRYTEKLAEARPKVIVNTSGNLHVYNDKPPHSRVFDYAILTPQKRNNHTSNY
ncbi:uncharacterized protein LOC117333842 [Pecten maximus]|uniref:uncharacterized protein LOC117333842 n=1 Tax=Pecten maximus TaxID=6579 RepID=UPI001457EB63|nr:uncharacterized protein LOC117333842 [Pecten maximus]